MTNSLTAAEHIAVQQVIASYAWALDTGDVESFAGCFCPDGELVWDAFEQPESWLGHDALRHFARFFGALPNSAGRQHHVSNIVITSAEEGLAARSYCMVALRQGDGPHALHVMGWYDDLFRQDQGQWLLARRVIRDWSGPVLGAFAGQTGERVARSMPPALAGLRYPPES